MKQRRGILIRMIPFALLAVGLAAADCWAVQPYTPVHPDPVLEPWRWTVFPELKGLGLQCIAEDREGRMWFGVADGVRVFDGANWTAYTEDDGVLGRPVQALCTARDGSVYAGTYTGVSRFRDGKWQRVFAAKDDIPLNVLAVIEASDRSIWAATWYGALRIRNEKATLHASADFESLILALAPNARFVVSPDEATTPRPWGGTRGAGIGVLSSTIGYRTRPLVIHTVLTGGPADAAGLRTGDRIMAIDGSSTGSLDIPAGTTATLTVEREGRAGSLEVTVTGKELKETYRDFWVYDAHEDREGLMWFGLRGGPICRYDPRKAGKDDAWRLYTEADGLDLESGSRIHRTGDGTVWAASRSERSGINRFDRQAWTSLRLSDLGGSNAIRSILETQDGTLWLGGHYDYLHAFRNGRWTVYRDSDAPLPSTGILGLLEASDGALWIAGDRQEAVRLDYKTSRWTTYEGLAFQCETPDGAQWFVSWDGGVVRHDSPDRSPRHNAGESAGAGTWRRYGVEDGLMEDAGGLLTTREGELWAVGSHQRNAATARFDGRNWSLQAHPQLSSRIWRVCESSDGALWFGAVSRIPERDHVGGVLRFDGQSWTHFKPPEVPS